MRRISENIKGVGGSNTDLFSEDKDPLDTFLHSVVNDSCDMC